MSVAVVLSGGGARGAYEVGALSVLLPELERRGERPTIVVGTSVGAFNAAYMAAVAALPTDHALDTATRIWSQLHYRDVLAPITSPRGIVRGLRFGGQLLGLRRRRINALLDPRPLPGTLTKLVSFEQLNANVREGRVTAAVTVTSARTSGTIVFHAGGGNPEHDEVRGIEYVPTDLHPDHVLASGAIPGLFPAVHVATPERARGWYFDGGTRLNTPIKPALELGADRVVVIGLNSIARATGPLASDEEPDLFLGAAQAMEALLVDRLTEDVRELAEENQPGGERKIPYVFVAPRERDAIGAIAARVYNERYAGVRGFLRDRNLSLLGRFVAGGDDAKHGELLSFLFFAPEFLRELIDLGRADAQRWVDERHDQGIWQLGPMPDQAEPLAA